MENGKERDREHCNWVLPPHVQNLSFRLEVRLLLNCVSQNIYEASIDGIRSRNG